MAPMLILARIVLTALTVAMLWPAGHLAIAAFKRSQPPLEIVKQAAVYTAVLIAIRWLFKKCSRDRD